MPTTIQQPVNNFLGQDKNQGIPVHWVKKDERSWLSQLFRNPFITPEITGHSAKIERLAQQTNRLGPQPLWKGYAGNNTRGPTRFPDDVRTANATGNLYTFLVRERKPNVVVEFGTAFGVSGMYFLAGIEANGKGNLLTFEPNDIWAKLARNNLLQISDRFNLIVGTFEENIAHALPRHQSIDMAFIDAIHTKEFVIPQLEIVVSKSSNRAIIILDDINFSPNMMECWREVASDSQFSSSVALGNRVGILELSR